MAHQKIQSQFGIGWIVLGSAGLEGFTIFGKRQRIDREKHKEVVFLERVDDRSLGQFNGNRDGAAKALV